jgi:hypothetical protein
LKDLYYYLGSNIINTALSKENSGSYRLVAVLLTRILTKGRLLFFFLHQSNRSRLVFLLVIGIVIREAFAPFTGHPYDFELWVRLGYYVSKGLDPYHQYPPVPNLSFPSSFNPSWPGYPPLWPLFLAQIYRLFAATGSDNRFVYYFLIKQPMVVADIIDSFLIFKLIKARADHEKATRAFAFWLLCPYTILISSIWGIFDQIILLFVLLSMYMISKAWKSSFMEAVAITLKLIPSIYLPLFAGLQSSRKKMLGYTLLTIAFTVILTFFPYLIFKSWSLPALEGVGLDVTNKFGHTLNYWEVLNNYWAYSNYTIPSNVGLFLRVIGLVWIPIILFVTYFCIKSVRKHDEKEFGIYFAISLLFLTLVFFLSKLVINEQYATYFLGFGLFDYFILADKFRKKLFHAMWITTFIELSINNALLLTFFEPISIYYATESSYFFTGYLGTIRLALMATLAVLFSILSFLYLKSLYKELRRSTKKLSEVDELVIVNS